MEGDGTIRTLDEVEYWRKEMLRLQGTLRERERSIGAAVRLGADIRQLSNTIAEANQIAAEHNNATREFADAVEAFAEQMERAHAVWEQQLAAHAEAAAKDRPLQVVEDRRS